MTDRVRLEKASTNVRDNAITMAVFIWTVTARAEQIPSICMETGLFWINGSENALKYRDCVSFIVHPLGF